MFYQKKNNKLEPLTGSTLYAESPIGTVIASFLAVAPSGYIKADGTVYTKAQYPELYERIPDVFKDTTNETFTIDLREVALKGIGLSSLTSSHYSSTGLTLGQFIEDQLQNHRHPDDQIGSNIGTGPNTGYARGTHNGSTGTGGAIGSDYRSGNTTEVKSVGVNYFIKAKHVALPIDIMDAISEEYATKEYVNSHITPTYTEDDSTVSVSVGITPVKLFEVTVPAGKYICGDFFFINISSHTARLGWSSVDTLTDIGNCDLAQNANTSDESWRAVQCSVHYYNSTNAAVTIYAYAKVEGSSVNCYYRKHILVVG